MFGRMSADVVQWSAAQQFGLLQMMPGKYEKVALEKVIDGLSKNEIDSRG
jgi:hypothetical protein